MGRSDYTQKRQRKSRERFENTGLKEYTQSQECQQPAELGRGKGQILL